MVVVAALRSFTLATKDGVDHVAGEHKMKVFTFRAVRHKFLVRGSVASTIFDRFTSGTNR